VTGETDRPFFLRSAAKPFQAAVSQALGARLSPEWLAVACSSHDGDPVHLAVVEAILASAGLTADALRCPPAAPLGRAARARLVETSPLTHNCSGKHAAMLAACVAQGWDTGSYLEPGHPLQVAIAGEMAGAFGPDTLPVGVDGCGAPVFRGSVASLAAGFSRLGTVSGYEEVLTAMLRYPALVSGVGNLDTGLAVWLGGAAKRGAEGCIALFLPGRGAIGLKVWDGNESRAVPVALVGMLEALGWIPEGPRRMVEEMAHRPVLGRGQVVGTVLPAFELERV
jgi:L-asparaginase II